MDKFCNIFPWLIYWFFFLWSNDEIYNFFSVTKRQISYFFPLDWLSNFVIVSAANWWILQFHPVTDWHNSQISADFWQKNFTIFFPVTDWPNFVIFYFTKTDWQILKFFSCHRSMNFMIFFNRTVWSILQIFFYHNIGRILPRPKKATC